MNDLLSEVKKARPASGEGEHEGGYVNPFGETESPVEGEGEGSGNGQRDVALAISPEDASQAVSSSGRYIDSSAESSQQSAATAGEKTGRYARDRDMLSYFQAIKRIDGLMEEVKAELMKLQALHIKVKITSSVTLVTEIRQDMAAHVRHAGQTCQQIVRLFEELEQEPKGKAAAVLGATKLRMRRTILAAKRKKFKALTEEFSSLRGAVHQDYRDIVARRYETVTGEAADPGEVERLIERGESEQIFQKAVLTRGKGDIGATLQEIDERHAAIWEIESGLLHLQQIFVDFATVVEQQSELIDNVQNHVDATADFADEGTKALEKSAFLHKSIQRKRLCIAILVCIGVIILAFILWPVIDRVLSIADNRAKARANAGPARGAVDGAGGSEGSGASQGNNFGPVEDVEVIEVVGPNGTSVGIVP